MRAHHAPTKCLLERFTFKDRNARSGRSIWVYEKGREPRVSRNLNREGVEHGYFAGASGEDEIAIDQRFNQQYELPFNMLLPAMDADLHILQSKEVRRICSLYVSHIFHRTQARRTGGEALRRELLDQYRCIASDATLLRNFAAMMSILARRSVTFDEVRSAILRALDAQESEDTKQSYYVNDLDRATEALAKELTDLNWTIIRHVGPRSLCISDTPIVSIAVDHRGEISYGNGVRKPLSSWFLPISHSRALRISNDLRLPERLNANFVQELNAAQVVTMSQRLYCRENEPWLASSVQKYGGLYKFHRDVFKGAVEPLSTIFQQL